MDEETKKLALEFCRRYLNLEINKKQISLDVKALKNEFAEQGLNCSMILRALKKIMRDAKMSESEKSDIEVLENLLVSDKDVTDGIASVQAK